VADSSRRPTLVRFLQFPHKRMRPAPARPVFLPGGPASWISLRQIRARGRVALCRRRDPDCRLVGKYAHVGLAPRYRRPARCRHPRLALSIERAPNPRQARKHQLTRAASGHGLSVFVSSSRGTLGQPCPVTPHSPNRQRDQRPAREHQLNRRIRSERAQHTGESRYPIDPRYHHVDMQSMSCRARKQSFFDICCGYRNWRVCTPPP
jgi:hypothetical protein